MPLAAARLLRTAIVLCLLLAALVLAADSAEYRQWTPAGLRALGRGALPLALLGAAHLALLPGDRRDGARAPHGAVAGGLLVADLLLLGVGVRMLARPGAPPLAALLVGVALLLLGATGAAWHATRARAA